MKDTESGSMAGIKIIGEADMGLDSLIKEMSKRTHLEIGVDESVDPEAAVKAIVNEFGYDSPGIPVTPKMRKWFAAQGYPLKATTQYIKIPARPFISKGIYDNLEDIWELIDRQTELIHNRKATVKSSMNLVGAFIVRKIQEYIERNDAKENHPMTSNRKGHDHPLIGHGGLKKSITYVVKGGRQK